MPAVADDENRVGESAKLPNFLLLGAQKAGTTSLYHYLAQHPEVFMCPVKEPHYFSWGDLEIGPNLIRGLDRGLTLADYRKLFTRVRGEKAIGEASTSYLASVRAARRIRELIPEARMIAVLRDPAERAHSNYVFNRRQLLDHAPDLSRALELEDERLAAGLGIAYGYREKGFYHAQLSEFYRLFDRRQMRIFLYQDLVTDPRAMVREIFGFLRVDPGFEPDMRVKYNVSGTPRSRLAAAALRLVQPVRAQLERRLPSRLVSRLGKMVLQRQEPEAGARRALIEAYRDDVLRLQDLIGRELSAWLRQG